jgi:hypothetical protein
MKPILSSFLILVSFTATTQDLGERKFVRVVDKELRMKHYMSCKNEGRKRCHFEAFEKSIKLKEIDI